jgi:GNAT superfamily N-acetyltransferase
MALVIRRAELADVVRLGELHSACWAELYSELLPAPVLADLSPETMAGLWHRFVARGDPYIQFVATVDDAVVGFAGIGPGRDVGYEDATELYFIYVDPSARRTGTGRRLLIQAAADYLWIHEKNRTAQAFYRKSKYFPDSVRRSGALFGAELPELRMSR